MKLNKIVLSIAFILLIALFFTGCGIIPTPTPTKGTISGQVLIPPDASSLFKDITGWVPAVNASVTVVDANGVTHSITTDENGYYAFENVAVKPNTVVTASVTINGKTVILKGVIPQAVATDEDYDVGPMTPKSTALALVVEKLLDEGVDPDDVDLTEIQASDSFTDLVEQVQTVIEEEGNIIEDPDVIAGAGNIADEIINPLVPPSPTPPAVIDIAAIPGVTAPVTGETPVTTITETDQYTGTVSWSPADSPFLGEVVYEATVTLTPKARFTLTGVSANFFTVAGATTTNDADSGEVTAEFPATEPAVIDIAAIPGVTAPVTGETPVTTITETDQYTGTVSWSPADSPFSGEVIYTATITLTAKTGFTLTGVSANFFTVAGATTTNDADSGEVTAEFPATEPAVIDIAAIPGVTAPVTGETPVTTITETDQYTGTVAWLPNDAAFLGEVVYEATVTLTAKTGFTLTGVSENFFTVAGATATNDADSGVVTATFPETTAVPVEFTSAVQTGGTSETADSTGLTLTFDVDPTTLAESDITVTGATKGTLSGTGMTRSLAISDITVGNGETVSVTITNPSGFTISGSPQTAEVYRAPYIGMAYQGGIVAYILQSGDSGYVAGETHGLISATADQSSSIIWAIEEFQSTSVPGGTLTTIGSGSANTDKIIGQNDPGITYAAGLARAYDGGGYDDWFLPSKNELYKLYLNRDAIGGFNDSYYWSSSEYDAGNAWIQYFSHGYQDYYYKDTNYRVRAVRAF